MNELTNGYWVSLKWICPKATQDLELNTKNRDRSIDADYIKYGPLNLSDDEYWEELADHWNTKVAVAKKSLCGNCVAFDISPRMDDCMPGQVSDKEWSIGLLLDAPL